VGAWDVVRQVLHAMQVIEHELLLFAAFWFVVGSLDELAMDAAWLWLKLKGKAEDTRLDRSLRGQALSERMAVFVPAWREANVIGAMVRHTLMAWPQAELRLYVGCYANDEWTLAAAVSAAQGDPRLRLVVHDRMGPTTKADCLNRIYEALCEDERRIGAPFGSIVLHDAEDMVHPSALPVLDRMLAHAQFVQLPVRPEPQPASAWIGSHYCEEFTEAHARTMVVRDALGAALPAAGVGCGFSRAMIGKLAAMRARAGIGAGSFAGPFAVESLTEDYELGLLAGRNGAGSRFVRLRDEDGSLIATRAYFPATLEGSVRQKARWVHGIAFQGWERLGWEFRPRELWMALRDRRGPLAAVVLAAGYGLVLLEAFLGVARIAGWADKMPVSPVLTAMVAFCLASFVWRAAWRFAFTAREYGRAEGARAVLRMPVANVIAIMASHRAFAAYLRGLRGEIIAWDKTEHAAHPAVALGGARVSR